MAFNIPASITGAAITGFTSPTYTTLADMPADPSTQKQVYVSAVGGTQTGVDAHSAPRPFTLMFQKAKQWLYLGKPNPVTGLLGSVPRNKIQFVCRKGVTVLAGQPDNIIVLRGELDMPAMNMTDKVQIGALLSAFAGALPSMVDGIYLTAQTNVG